MAQPHPRLILDRDFDPHPGEPVTVAKGLVRVSAANAGPHTFTGTNSFVIGEETVFMLDPGPDDAAHVEALLAAVGTRRVEAVLLTHTHRDHAESAGRVSERLGAPLWFAGPHAKDAAGLSERLRHPDRVLADGDRIAAGGTGLEILATPGHCANHVAFGIENTEILLSGDHVMGWSSTLIARPDGSMRDYLESLDKVIAAPYRLYVPAHGGPIADGPGHARALKAHRLARNGQVLEAVRGGAHTVGAITRAVYPGIALPLVPAARKTAAAHVDYLAAEGALAVRQGAFGPRIHAAE